jgi:hypothetical protein
MGRGKVAVKGGDSVLGENGEFGEDLKTSKCDPRSVTHPERRRGKEEGGKTGGRSYPVEIIDRRTRRHIHNELAPPTLPRPLRLQNPQQTLHLLSLFTNQTHVRQPDRHPPLLGFLLLALSDLARLWIREERSTRLGLDFDDDPDGVPEPDADELGQAVGHGRREEAGTTLFGEVREESGEGWGEAQVE